MALLAQGDSVPRRGVTKRLRRPSAGSGRAGQPSRIRPEGVEVGRGGRLGLDEIDVPAAGDAELGNDLAEAGLQTVAPEGRQGREALEDDHVRGFPWETRRPL